ncbi:ferredoxin 2 [Peptoclostridium acidaminophilum DSM 3953]|uniref:Ferredoxin 2 n=1 Tax=Peptoclostridium acidaminophilum DSM 3953 TaxID=1286171 RepID=W8TJ15_PEPAC|nr:[Fe-Fe] hydrogenase large subunit C-terminal domain-containing protein [Peptoclostridium acidaminophilum]AHM56177.1 ferredoxin 2 [Peptoclostridium acidaminophilum DSM 3953]
MDNFLEVVKSNCRGCYRCVMTCPVKAVKIEEDKAEIVDELCISCGNCYRECPHDAIRIMSDIGQVREYIRLNYKVIASVDPHIVSDFNGMGKGKFIAALKALGFYRIEDTSMAAYTVMEFSKSYIKKNQVKGNAAVFISSYCNCSTQLIRKYNEELLEHIIPVDSPMVAHAKFLKEKYGRDTKVVHIGPCISRKVESMESQNRDYIDKVLTFSQVIGWIHSSGIALRNLEDKDFDGKTAKEGCVQYNPLSVEAPEGEVIGIDVRGIRECKDFISSMKRDELKGICVSIGTCTGACAGGPDYKHRQGVLYRKQKLKEFEAEADEISDISELDSTYRNLNIVRQFSPIKLKTIKPAEREIKQALCSMGKNSEIEELDCGACGYKTCREKAIAICKGMSEPKNCRIFMHERLNRMSNKVFELSPNYIVIVGEDFRIIDINEAMIKVIGESKERLIGSYIGDYMDIKDFVEVLYSKQDIISQKSRWENFDKDIIENMIYLTERKAIFAILNDNTKEESQKRMIQEMKIRTIDISQNLIEKQMRVAQEIASLLGESTAETKIILSSLKELALKEQEYY